MNRLALLAALCLSGVALAKDSIPVDIHSSLTGDVTSDDARSVTLTIQPRQACTKLTVGVRSVDGVVVEAAPPEEVKDCSPSTPFQKTVLVPRAHRASRGSWWWMSPSPLPAAGATPPRAASASRGPEARPTAPRPRSTRRHTDLPTARAADASALMHALANNDSNNPAYPIGNTAHANLSTIWAVPRSPLWDDASFLGEIAWNRMLDCEKNCAVLPPNGTRNAWQIAAVMTPTYYQVLSGLNLSLPIGLNYTPKGSRSMALGAGPSGPENGGTVNIGVQGLYLDAWRFGLTYNHYFGKAAYALVGSSAGNEFSYQQSLKDRDYVSFALSRTF